MVQLSICSWQAVKIVNAVAEDDLQSAIHNMPFRAELTQDALILAGHFLGKSLKEILQYADRVARLETSRCISDVEQGLEKYRCHM